VLKHSHQQVCVVSCALVALVALYFMTTTGSLPTSCEVREMTEIKKEAIVRYDGIVQWGLTLTTAMIGFYSAIAMGIQRGTRIPPLGVALFPAGALCAVAAAYFGVSWQSAAAMAYWNNNTCFITASVVADRFNAAAGFLIASLAFGAASTLLSTIENPAKRESRKK